MEQRWLEVDGYFAEHFAPSDDVLNAVLRANAAVGLPAHDISPLQGRFLELLVRLMCARRVLEVGTLGAYSTIWMARALPSGGRIVTIEADARHAEVARGNLARASMAHMVDVRVGPALDVLPAIAAEGRGPFDLVFIDADKRSNPDYLNWALKLTRSGSLIVGDNVVRDGAVADGDNLDPSVLGVRCFIEMMAREPRLVATALQTVGSKGWDGFAMAVVR